MKICFLQYSSCVQGFMLKKKTNNKKIILWKGDKKLQNNINQKKVMFSEFKTTIEVTK